MNRITSLAASSSLFLAACGSALPAPSALVMDAHDSPAPYRVCAVKDTGRDAITGLTGTNLRGYDGAGIDETTGRGNLYGTLLPTVPFNPAAGEDPYGQTPQLIEKLEGTPEAWLVVMSGYVHKSQLHNCYEQYCSTLSSDGSLVNLRATPGGRVLGGLMNRVPLTVMSSEGNWRRVEIRAAIAASGLTSCIGPF